MIMAKIFLQISSFFTLLLLLSSVNSQGYYFFNGRFYSNQQRNSNDFESKKTSYCTTTDFYTILNLQKSDLHDIKIEDDFDSFFDVPDSNHQYTERVEKLKNENSKKLKKEYKKLAVKLHPDKNKDDPFAEAKFTEVQAAYEVLKDPKLKNEYDKIYADFCLKDSLKNKYEQEKRTKYGKWASALKRANLEKNYKIYSDGNSTKGNLFHKILDKMLQQTYYSLDFDLKNSPSDLDVMEKVHIDCYNRMAGYVTENPIYKSVLALIVHCMVNIMFLVWYFRTFKELNRILLSRQMYNFKKEE